MRLFRVSISMSISIYIYIVHILLILQFTTRGVLDDSEMRFGVMFEDSELRVSKYIDGTTHAPFVQLVFLWIS